MVATYVGYRWLYYYGDNVFVNQIERWDAHVMTFQRHDEAKIIPQHRERRKRLLAAAAAAIAERGFEGVRLRDVAAECGVTTGMLQYYFASREKLLHAAFEHAALDQVAGWRKAISGKPVRGERLQVLLDHMVEEFSSPTTCSIWTELCATASRHHDLRPLVSHVFGEWHAIIREVVDDATADGAIRPAVPVDDAIRILVAAFDGYELDLASSSGSTNPASASQQIMQLADLLFPRTRRG
ncbi:MAG: TetR family transcriptional regulator [Candidatus Saccharibacteria bacterium]|nr:TetR family transcriptional regulator [Microbacteriaceae bacterium]